MNATPSDNGARDASRRSSSARIRMRRSTPRSPRGTFTRNAMFWTIVIGAITLSGSVLGSLHSATRAAASGAGGIDPQPQFVPSILTSPNAEGSGFFGTALAVSGPTVVVGANNETAAGQAGAGRAYVFNLNTGARMTLTSPNAQHDGGFGTSVAISGSTVVVGAPSEYAAGLAHAGNVYTFSATTGDLLGTVASPNAQSAGGFGSSVAISGTTMLVGAWGETVLAQTFAGHVYVVNLGTNSIKMLTSPNAQSIGRFGWSVALAGSIALVGAPSETAGALASAGHAYAFSTTTGDLITTLTSPNAQSFGYFGYSVAISGSTAVVGASGETISGLASAGRAYALNLGSDTMQTLTSPVPESGGEFGFSVAVSGPTIVAGAPDESVSGVSEAGHTYSFSATSGDLLLGNFSSPDGATDGWFGFAVAVSGSTVVVGAPEETAGGFLLAGHAYYFADRPLGLTSPNAQGTGLFGFAVAVSGSTVVVGAPHEAATGLSDAGHAYLLNLNTERVITLTSPTPQTTGFFGWSVAVSGSTVVVGAPDETASGLAGAGHAYLFSASTGDLLGTLASPNAQAGGVFGGAVAISASTVVVAAYGEKNGSTTSAGHVYAFNATNDDLALTLTSPNAQIGGYFGYTVAVSASAILVGAPDETALGRQQAGHAYAFNPSTGAPLATLTSPNALIDGAFGSSVSLSGSTAVVGTPYETVSSVSDAGQVYVWNATSGELLSTLASPNPQASGDFGYSVAVSGSTVVVGAPGETADGAVTGSVYTFAGAPAASSDRFVSLNPTADGEFGIAVAISGSTIVVGADFETVAGSTDAGHAYLF